MGRRYGLRPIDLKYKGNIANNSNLPEKAKLHKDICSSFPYITKHLDPHEKLHLKF